MPRWQHIVIDVNVMSTSTVGRPQAAARRIIVADVSPAGSPLPSSTSPTCMHRSSTCCTCASEGTSGPTGRSRSAVGGPPRSRSCASRRNAPRNLRVSRPMRPVSLTTIRLGQAARRRNRRAQGRRTHCAGLDLAYPLRLDTQRGVREESRSEHGRDPDRQRARRVAGRRRGRRPPLARRRDRRPGRRVRPGPHGRARGRAARRRVGARRGRPLRGRPGQGRPPLRRPSVVGQPGLPADRAHLPRHRGRTRQRGRRVWQRHPEPPPRRAGPVRRHDPDQRARPPRTSSRRTRPRSSARSTPAARACCAASATSSATCATTAACPRWSSGTRSTVGSDLALTPGAVVQRDEVGEVIQYQPSTEQVYQRPLLIIPPPIGRFYFLDLRPGRSFVEYAVGQGIADVPAQLAQPDRRAGRLGPRHLRRAGARRRSTRSARSPAATTST